MVLINKAINEITVKLVYYGPGLCGKTTNLEKIYGNPKLDNKGKMISMATETDRTLFFDFMPMELGTIGGQKVRVQLYTVPGQVFYDATRKLVLRGADGVVFVADSQSTMRESNLDSLENLKTNLRLNRIDPEKVALVFQYNKRDLPNVDTAEDMNEYLHTGTAPVVEAQAKNNVGVTATLRAAVGRMLENLKNNVDTTLYNEPELSRPDLTARSGVTPSSAGMPKLSMKTAATSAPQPIPIPMPAPIFTPVEAEPTAASPFEAVAVAEPDVDENPFGAMHTEPAAEAEAYESPFESPFGTPTEIHDPTAERAELEELLASARAVTASLQDALERARRHEGQLADRLQRL
jgi:signal recognition particle receptor subunit beta